MYRDFFNTMKRVSNMIYFSDLFDYRPNNSDTNNFEWGVKDIKKNTF